MSDIQQGAHFGEVRRLTDENGRVHTFRASAFMPRPEVEHRRETYWLWTVEEGPDV